MTVEERLRDALHRADGYAPSPDLFARVQRSIEEDQAHRRRMWKITFGIGAVVAAALVWVLLFIEVRAGQVSMPWWSLEILTNAVMVALVVALGPLIRRFGRTYAADVFRTHSTTGDRFLGLLDVAYYLVFTAYIVLWLFFEPSMEWLGPAGFSHQLDDSLARVGGLFLLMGLLHGVMIFVMPFIGLVFASTRHRVLVRERKDQWVPEVRRAHRTATIIIWAIVILGGLFLFQQLIGLVLALIGGLSS
jgi:hypothetical protein